MKKLLLICAFTFMYACKSNDELVGTYTTVKHSRFALALGHINGTYYSVRDTMTLNKDSTFVFESCAMVLRGRWSATPDTVELLIDEKRFKIEEHNTDTAYSKALRITGVPIKIAINGKHLVKKTEAVSGKTLITKLVKIND